MTNNSFSSEDIKAVTSKLARYCEENDWAGYDPYDALNSKLFQAVPFLNARIPRLVLTQALKRSPINIRGPLLVPKTQNAKAIGLFLSAYLNLSRTGLIEGSNQIWLMIERLITLRSQ